jgi:hypothetical protein
MLAIFGAYFIYSTNAFNKPSDLLVAADRFNGPAWFLTAEIYAIMFLPYYREERSLHH